MPNQRDHYLKPEPSVPLWDAGPSFSLFYDYDQLYDRKLTSLSSEQKALWFCARIEMTFLRPLRRIFADTDSDVFIALLDTKSMEPRSFSIALMSVMLNGVESLGSFLRPGSNKRESFRTFIEHYMAQWSGHRPVPSIDMDLLDILWYRFRNGIAHGFCIEGPGSVEFLTDSPFSWDGTVLKVCPIHFWRDLDRGVLAYFNDLRANDRIREQFSVRFGKVYPS